MIRIKNKTYKYICPVVNTCANYRMNKGTGRLCLHCIPHNKTPTCLAGVCGIEFVPACKEVTDEENN